MIRPLPNSLLTMRLRAIRLRYTHDPDITCVPGCSQPIYNVRTGEEYARVFWDGFGKHRLQTPHGTFDVTNQDGIYSFSWDGFHFAVLAPYQGLTTPPPLPEISDPDREYSMIMISSAEPPADLAMMMLNFPFLQIRP